MSDLSPTLNSLVALGFKRVAGGAAETVRYEFKNFQLNASSVMWWTGRMVMLGGSGNTGRKLLVMDPGDLSSAKMIPNDLGSAEAAAWVSFMLQPWRNDLGPLPDWFVEGERHWDLVPTNSSPRYMFTSLTPRARPQNNSANLRHQVLVPPAREQLAYEERHRAYQASPKCIIDRDYARPLRRNLTEDISWLEEGEELEMTFSFDGRVLTIDSGARRVHGVVASGDSWPTSYRAVVTPDSKLPARFETYWVEVSVFEGHLCWDRLPLAPCEPVA